MSNELNLTDPVLDAKDPHTRLLLLADHWKRKYQELATLDVPAKAEPSDALPDEITPMFLLNAAICIESPRDCSTRSKREIVAKLHRLAAEIQDAKIARILGGRQGGGDAPKGAA